MAVAVQTPTIQVSILIGLELVIDIHEMLNVIIRYVHFYFLYFTDNICRD